jgi:hypothetical protein
MRTRQQAHGITYHDAPARPCRIEPNTSMNLREQVEQLLPNWESWYPTLFDAACDLGLLRARVCSLSSLLLSNRHASIQGEALQAFREQWSVEQDPEVDGRPERHESGAESRTPTGDDAG